ncbi:MAG: 3'-5' exonuclease [Anaerolineales bacterium]|nr:3'-5' exonuclease [Anaerolineales bacterium]
MARVYVSLDIETTGLDPEQDAILEIGAIRFKGSQVYESYHTLLDPGRPIPYKIQQLTGITPADLKGAPKIGAVLSEVRRFVGDNPIIGHNIGFDLSFLVRQGLFEQNVGIDTFELASILLPHAGRYGLSALLKYLDVKLPPDGQAHRALDDAEAARRLFEALLDQARRLDSRIIEEVAQIASKTDWPLAYIFRDLGRERRYTPPAGTLGQQLAAKGLMDDSAVDGGFALMRSDPDSRAFDPPLKPVTNPTPLDIRALSGLLEDDGLFERSFPKFDASPEQWTCWPAWPARSTSRTT